MDNASFICKNARVTIRDEGKGGGGRRPVEQQTHIKIRSALSPRQDFKHTNQFLLWLGHDYVYKTDKKQTYGSALGEQKIVSYCLEFSSPLRKLR